MGYLIIAQAAWFCLNWVHLKLITHYKLTTLNDSKISLIVGLANQMSTAVLNIIANQEIQQREEKKSRLLAFSNAMASVRDNTIFAKILKQQLDKLFGIKYYVIHAQSDYKKTLSYFVRS